MYTRAQVAFSLCVLGRGMPNPSRGPKAGNNKQARAQVHFANATAQGVVGSGSAQAEPRPTASPVGFANQLNKWASVLFATAQGAEVQFATATGDSAYFLSCLRISKPRYEAASLEILVNLVFF